MTRPRVRVPFAACAAVLLLAAGCDRPQVSGPPSIQLGESVCDDCGMIISDERFAAAMTVADPDRGPRPALFDDIGDMVRYEAERPDLVVLDRWVHDHDTREWLEAAAATYLVSPDLHTPMATGIAAFASREAAERMRGKVGGRVVAFEALVGER